MCLITIAVKVFLMYGYNRNINLIDYAHLIMGSGAVWCDVRSIFPLFFKPKLRLEILRVLSRCITNLKDARTKRFDGRSRRNRKQS